MKTEKRIEPASYVGMIELLEFDPERELHYSPETGELVRDNGDGETLTVVKIITE